MMNAGQPRSVLVITLLVGAALSTCTADGAVIAVGTAAFPINSTLITFSGLANNTEMNGLTVAGVLFNYNLGNGNAVIDGGPGVTNNINPPNVVSVGNDAGILTLTLPGASDMFGYGYAILGETPIANATTITLFSGLSNVGTLSYNGVPDPLLTGGFAGIQSTIPFNRVQVTFNSGAAPAFALDNVRISASSVPEPSAILLVLSGVAGLFWHRRQSRSS